MPQKGEKPMHPTDILKAEHRIIEMVLAALDKLAIQAELDIRIDEQNAADILDFLKNFADKCHHAKEENHLFQLMEQRGFPNEHGPIAVMLYEHEQGRALIRQMSETLNRYSKNGGENLNIFIQAARNYVALMQQHILKEDYHLFPMAESVFSQSDRQNLLATFEKMEKEEIGQDTHEKFHAVAERLAKEYQIRRHQTDLTHAGPCGTCH
jgi:hemerythrin-like domain-containing protein